MMKLEREIAMEQFAPVKRSKDGQPVRYLIVDDSVFARKNLARMIETFGGQVAAEAGDGLTAISEYDRTHPDIVLMDIAMPQMEGIEAAEKIVQAHPEARIVMVSSVGYQENIVAALQRGDRHFGQKPVEPEGLDSHYAGAKLPESDGLIKETIFELANQVVGNAVCALNDQGFHFRVHPPLLLNSAEGDKSSEDVEALMICFETSLGNVFMNVALRYNKRRMSDHATVGV